MTTTVLVTGGAGYVGSHACKALAQAGYTPIVYDNLVYGHRWAVKWGPLEVGELAERAKLDAFIDRYRPTAVMHFAAYAYVGESVADPNKYYRNNVAATLTLLDSIRAYGIDKFIFSSTCATYGVPETELITEQHPQRPINPYGRSKLMVEWMLRDFEPAYGLRSIFLRYFNAAGADPQGEIGEQHDPETHLIPLVLEAAAGLRPEAVILGDDYPTPDGTCIRDYIHVTDLAQAHVLALQALEAGAPTQAYNLGNGRGYSVRQVIDTAQRVSGRDIAVSVGPRRPGDPARLVADASRSIRELGWRPRYTELDDSIGSAWNWLQGREQPRGSQQ